MTAIQSSLPSTTEISCKQKTNHARPDTLENFHWKYQLLTISYRAMQKQEKKI